MRRASLLLVMAAGACVGTAPAPRQSEAMERSARMLAALDRLEADLHSRDAEMATYSELIERHSQTQQIACKVTDEHVLDLGRITQRVVQGEIVHAWHAKRDLDAVRLQRRDHCLSACHLAHW